MKQNQKCRFIIALIIIIISTINFGFTREQIKDTDGNPGYRYKDADEFYSYWNKTSDGYKFVEIGIINAKYSSYGWASQMRGVETFYVYQNGDKQLVAIFTDYTDFLYDGFRRFDLVINYYGAVKYWNALINNM